MSKVKISEINDAPLAGSGKQINFTHPLTEMKYCLAMFHVEEKYYVITDECKVCGGSLGQHPDLRGMFAACGKEECLWNIRRGSCKFDRSSVIPTYRVSVMEDGLYIEI
jgi:nitrite reductase/ring-hydroxylating ferredoxin subunit